MPPNCGMSTVVVSLLSARLRVLVVGSPACVVGCARYTVVAEEIKITKGEQVRQSTALLDAVRVRKKNGDQKCGGGDGV